MGDLKAFGDTVDLKDDVLEIGLQGLIWYVG